MAATSCSDWLGKSLEALCYLNCVLQKTWLMVEFKRLLDTVGLYISLL